MDKSSPNDLIRAVDKIRAIAQTGLSYTKDPYDKERYEALQNLVIDLLEQLSVGSKTHLSETLKSERGYATPKVDVRALIFQNDEVLLVRERSDGNWTVPGGWADVGESPSKCVEKEVKEESGYEVKVSKVLAVYDRDKHEHPPMAFHVYKIFFLCKIVGGKPAITLETDGVEFFKVGDLPKLSTERVTASQIKKFFIHFQHQEMPTEFD